MRKKFLSVPAGLLALCLIVAVAGVTWQAWDMFSPARRPMLQGWDDSFYYFWLPSVVIDGDLDFSNQLAGSGTVAPHARAWGLAQPRTVTGLLPNKYPPGWAIGSLPFFLAAHATTAAGASGFEPRYLLAVWLGQLLYAAAGLWFAARILARYFPARTAMIAVLAVWLASPLIYYQSARLSMSHSQVFALATVASWLALRITDGDRRPRIWALLGFSCALLVVTRNVAIVYLALPAVIVATKLRSGASAGWLALGAAVPLAVQLAAWKILYGSWFVYSYGDEQFDFSHPHLGEILFSARHGWFHWHPLLLAGIAAFVVWAWRRVEGRAWLVSLAAVVVLNSAWPAWWLGSSFGHRGFEAATLFAMIGFAALATFLQTRPPWRRAFIAIVALAVCWNLALFALFLTRRIPRDTAVTYCDAGRALVTWAGGGR